MKYLLIISIALMISINLYSQPKFGIRAGLNLANISEDLGGTETIDIGGESIEVTIDQSNRTTFSIGGVVEFWLSPMFALQVNALYNQKGTKLKGDFRATIVEQGLSIDVTGAVEETMKLDYLSFPVLGKLAFGQSKVKPYIIAGPEIGFLLSAKDKAKATAEGEALGEKVGPITAEEEIDLKESLETFEFALDFGAGLIIPLGSIDAFVDAQYSLGLTKLNKEGELSTKNKLIMITGGLLFSPK